MICFLVYPNGTCSIHVILTLTYIPNSLSYAWGPIKMNRKWCASNFRPKIDWVFSCMEIVDVVKCFVLKFSVKLEKATSITVILELAWYISLGGWVIPVGFMTSNWSYFEFFHHILQQYLLCLNIFCNWQFLWIESGKKMVVFKKIYLIMEKSFW